MATTGRKEALRLYRDILRTIRVFEHKNEHGVPWKNIIRDSTRQEFEIARYESDPNKVVEMLMVGRDCLMKIQEGIITGKVDKEEKSNKYDDTSPFHKV
ncbi:hypothetical protein DLAC_00179 [Tieghemostelium lacteum]|uniref:Complex 1 LYR protein domain-containing protein n=1 Tax=Tieghemostelium lacteum TaxID=361077 RepID=A0A152A9B1_TIELA|nr:hypothetical protein DLAC_00179 [Tieghemostelium lacteum]|eukprot:KYR02715.1 hypothetical protein DLAC_00179 [Tieghemostelium lacteum]